MYTCTPTAPLYIPEEVCRAAYGGGVQMEYINCQAVPSEVKKDAEGNTAAGQEGNDAGEPSETAEIGDVGLATDVGTGSEAIEKVGPE
ncbi:hypothetical protein CYMTET_31966 [Cymbomonas tetramitiformis]|uniref:Uncharacterized protein n=1 Tax=Cymbomonas tetramitiformis TaxID=36881 RepID=A0AAE0FFY7_9CHLO|nr:hypothetical protein CYMTET_31966 [Cymbomonas tetramitiformis]